MTKFSGCGTTADGKHVQFSAEQAESLWKSAEAAKEARKESMPDTNAALRQLCSGRVRLYELGWSDASYCPKDGAPFAVIQYGSSGIFSAFYQGEWPNGRVVMDDFCVHPDGLLWKAIDKMSEDEAAKLKECDAATVAHMERDAKIFGALSD